MVQLPGKAFIAHNILRIMFSVKKPAQAVHFVLSSFIVLTLFGGKNNQTVPQMQGNPSQGENAKRLLVSVKADHVKLSFPLSSSASVFYCGSTEQFPTVSTKVFFFFFLSCQYICVKTSSIMALQICMTVLENQHSGCIRRLYTLPSCTEQITVDYKQQPVHRNLIPAEQ